MNLPGYKISQLKLQGSHCPPLDLIKGIPGIPRSTFVAYILIISLHLVFLHRVLWLLEVLLLFPINSYGADFCHCFSSNVLFLKQSTMAAVCGRQ